MMLALSGIAAASASAALPEFQKEGKPLTEAVKFSASAKGPTIEGASGSEDVCGTQSWTGETKGATELANVTIKVAECSNGYPCVQFEAKELKGRIGYVSAGVVGLLLETATQPFATCTVGKRPKIIDSLLGGLTPLNVATKELSLTYQQGSGVQAMTDFEGETPIHALEVGTVTYEQMGIETSLKLKMEKAIEVKG
jgi:hypothetical protein